MSDRFWWNLCPRRWTNEKNRIRTLNHQPCFRLNRLYIQYHEDQSGYLLEPVFSPLQGSIMGQQVEQTMPVTVMALTHTVLVEPTLQGTVL